MKKYKAIQIMLLIFLTMNAALAQRSNVDPKQAAKEQTEKMKTSLNLSADQLSQVEQINLEAAEKMAAIRSNGLADRRAVRDELEAVGQERDQQLIEVLNDEQLATWSKLRAEAKQNRTGKRGTRNN